MRNPEVTKENILKESGILFNTQGYKATSLSDITDATGYTKGAIYRHFRNKEDLEVETLSYLSGIMFEKLRNLVKQQHSAGDKLRAILNFFESYVTTSPIEGGCPLLNVAIEADDALPILREEAAKTLKILKDSLIMVLNNGIKYKQLTPDADKEFFASLFIAALEGAIMMGKLSGNNEDMKIVVRHLESQIKKIEI